MEEARRPNQRLRCARLQRGWSQQRVADLSTVTEVHDDALMSTTPRDAAAAMLRASIPAGCR